MRWTVIVVVVTMIAWNVPVIIGMIGIITFRRRQWRGTVRRRRHIATLITTTVVVVVVVVVVAVFS